MSHGAGGRRRSAREAGQDAARAFVIWGFTVWLRTSRTVTPAIAGVPTPEEVGR